MIVLLNIKEKNIELYSGSGITKIPFVKAKSLAKLIGGKDIIYVTNAVKTNASSVIETVSGIIGVPVSDMDSGEKIVNNIVSGSPSYVRVKKGSLLLNDIDLTFDDPSHFLPLNIIYRDHGANIFEKHPVLKSYKAAGKFEFVTLDQKKQIEKDIQSKKDKELDSITVKGNVSDYMDGIGDDGDDSSSSHDAIEIDVSGSGNFKGGGSNNESGLLPSDM